VFSGNITAYGTLTVSALSGSAVSGEILWQDYTDNEEEWTVLTHIDEAWSASSTTTEEWTRLTYNDESWTPATDAEETWNAA